MNPRRYPVISGRELIRRLSKAYNYEIIRQKGSHIRIRTYEKGRHSLTVPTTKSWIRACWMPLLALWLSTGEWINRKL